MARRDRIKGISSKQAFDTVWSGSKKSQIPQEVEDRLLDSFTRFCEDKSREDVYLEDLTELFQDYVGIDQTVVYFIEKDKYVIEGLDRQIVDFEKYLYQGALVVAMEEKKDVVDYYWQMVMENLKGMALTASEKSSVWKRKLSLKEVDKLMRNMKQSTTTDVLMKMLQVGGAGKLYVTWWDMGVILGRIGDI